MFTDLQTYRTICVFFHDTTSVWVLKKFCSMQRWQTNHKSREIQSSMAARVHSEVVMEGAEFGCPVPVILTAFMPCWNMWMFVRLEDLMSMTLIARLYHSHVDWVVKSEHICVWCKLLDTSHYIMCEIVGVLKCVLNKSVGKTTYRILFMQLRKVLKARECILLDIGKKYWIDTEVASKGITVCHCFKKNLITVL